MVKCEICKEKIPTTFLNKLVGTTIYDKNHKKRYICAKCQREHAKENLQQIIENE